MDFKIDPDDLHDVSSAPDIMVQFREQIARKVATGDVVRVTSMGEHLFTVGPTGIVRGVGILVTN